MSIWSKNKYLSLNDIKECLAYHIIHINKTKMMFFYFIIDTMFHIITTLFDEMLMQYLACDQLECHCSNGQTSVNNATAILY